MGQPRVSVDGREHDVPAGSRRLLAFTAVHRTRLERSYVAGTLWPTYDDVRAIGNLRSALWRLRGAGIDVIIADKRSIVLDPRVAVDVQLTACWADRLIAGRPEPTDLDLQGGRLSDGAGATVLADACQLFSTWLEEWALLEHHRLRQRVLHALEAAARLLAEQGRTSEAIAVATDAVAIDPLRESAQRCLIAAHLAAGDLPAAELAYASFRDLVRGELGVSPSPRLTALLPQPAAVTIRASSAEGPLPTSAPSWTR